VTSTQCTIPKEVLHDVPFDLPWGSHIYARVIATNIYGSSEISVDGNGGIIVHQPEKPINLVEDYSLRTPTTLGLMWDNGLDDGGLPVLDFRISYSEVDGIYSLLESNIVLNSYLATNLVSGTEYKFKVESRNAHGYSDYSDEILLLAAFKPLAPETVQTANSAD
jgi:hypothetical protein